VGQRRRVHGARAALGRLTRVTKAYRTLVRDGARLSVRDWGGNGPAVLLVHGLTGSQRMWRVLAPLLAERHRVVTYDQRCHGRSSGSANYSWSAFVDDLEAVVNELELRDVTLVGHSFGAAIVLEVAVGNENCRALALLDGAFPVPEPPPDGRPGHMLMRGLVIRAKWMLLRSIHRVHSLTSSQLRQVGDDYRGRFEEYGGALKALDCPTTLVLGSEMEPGREGPEYQVARQNAAIRAVEYNPDIDVHWIEAQHNMILTHAPEISELLFRLASRG
jgi:esterase